KLDGQDKGYNDNMRARAVVMHEADYVSEAWIKKYGRLGRSQGCPALPKEISKKVIDTIKQRTLIFAYAQHETFLETSAHLKLDNIIRAPDAVTILP
ncbi:MAG TPA: murein L,D-transpeptidase catalytic domain family protein, partial [Cyclobacteriaceae bacterium]|nr:murein L,D-transpeptidase catalytic domain family protein [Cyclobacteriaceae bacterium]